MSAVSSNTVRPAWPISPSAAAKLVIERQVEIRRRVIGAQRAAHLHRAHRPAAGGAAADSVDQFAQRDAEAHFEQAAVLHVAGQLDRHRALDRPKPTAA
jgi:hypothetical protein